jgi:hypothetical protein
MAFDKQLSQSLGGWKFELSLQDKSGQIANFYAAETDVVEAIQDAGLECAYETQAIAYELCAFKTGFMRDHLDVYVSENMRRFEIGWKAADFFDAGFPFYPAFVVLGTRFQAPRDPLTPAYAETKPLYESRVAAAIQVALERRRMM